PPKQSDQPRRRVLLEIAEGPHGREPGALEPLIRFAADQLDRELQAESPVHARHTRERLADDQGDGLRIARIRVSTEGEAHVAAAATRERLGLVAEVTQDRVVAAAAALRPADPLEEHAPL